MKAALRSTLFTALGLGLAASLSASAEWRVYDDSVESEVKEVNKKLASQNKIGSGDFKHDDADGEKQGRFKDPPKKFTTADQDKPSSVAMTESMRCPEPKAPKAPDGAGGSAASVAGVLSSLTGGGIPKQQWQICKEILETERAQFKYSLMMSELAQKRYERLQDIQEQRGSIDSDNVGELASNTNKLIALLTLIQIDQQQHKTYNDAYAARLTYLHAMNARLSQAAVTGSRGNDAGGSLISSSIKADAAALGVMALAFSDNSPLRAERRGN